MGVKILTRWELLRRKRSVVFNQLTVGKRGMEPFLPPGLLFSDHREGSYPPPLAGVWFGGGRGCSGVALRLNLLLVLQRLFSWSHFSRVALVTVLSVTSYAGRRPLFLGASQVGLPLGGLLCS